MVYNKFYKIIINLAYNKKNLFYYINSITKISYLYIFFIITIKLIAMVYKNDYLIFVKYFKVIFF